MHPTAEQEARRKAIQAATEPLKEQIDRLWQAIRFLAKTEKGFDGKTFVEQMKRGTWRN